MTRADIAQSMRRIADMLDSHPELKKAYEYRPSSMLNEEAAVGAALVIRYLRDLVTNAGRDQWDRPSVLVILQAVADDPEIFPLNIGRMIWDEEDDDSEDDDDSS